MELENRSCASRLLWDLLITSDIQRKFIRAANCTFFFLRTLGIQEVVIKQNENGSNKGNL